MEVEGNGAFERLEGLERLERPEKDEGLEGFEKDEGFEGIAMAWFFKSRGDPASCETSLAVLRAA